MGISKTPQDIFLFDSLTLSRPEFSFQRYNTMIHFSNLPAGLIASGMSGRHSNAPYQCLSIEAPYGYNPSPPSY
jgi:hypothetical protein